MKLTHYSDYSLRVLIYLGVRNDRLVTISEIAESYDISRNHVVKVVHHLGRLGYVDTLRGKHGGMRLAQNPEHINVGKLVRETEASLQIVECFGDDNACVLSPVCVLKSVLNEALGAFLATLDNYTLKDLIKPAPQIDEQLIHIAPARIRH
jgi:Rrf2 family nitric oxide-sensitive transcriptional repressor